MISTSRWLRRSLTVPGLFLLAAALTATIPIWVVLGAAADLVRLKFRLPIVRLLAFAVCWSWLEVAGVTVAFGLWVTGRGGDGARLYSLQRWWAAKLLDALRLTLGLRLQIENAHALRPGPVLLFARHASLADSLVSAHVIASHAGMQPRVVMKRELLLDPCLDIVGQRTPNHFLDREAADSATELAALGALAAGMGPLDVGVIFPEGTRASSAKRDRAIERIAVRDPERAARMSKLQHLLPPRPSGAAAMAAAAPDADVVLAWHVGFEGFDTFGGILRGVGAPLAPIRYVARRVHASDVPRDERFAAWLDEEWLELDSEVDEALQERTTRRRSTWAER